jgi:hypothetical protein
MQIDKCTHYPYLQYFAEIVFTRGLHKKLNNEPEHSYHFDIIFLSSSWIFVGGCIYDGHRMISPIAFYFIVINDTES